MPCAVIKSNLKANFLHLTPFETHWDEINWHGLNLTYSELVARNSQLKEGAHRIFLSK